MDKVLELDDGRKVLVYRDKSEEDSSKEYDSVLGRVDYLDSGAFLSSAKASGLFKDNYQSGFEKLFPSQ